MRQNVLGLGSAKLLGGLALLGSCALLTGCEGGSGAGTAGTSANEQAVIGGDQQAETNSETPPLPGATSQSADQSGDGPGNNGNGNGNGNNGSDDGYVGELGQTGADGTVEEARIDLEEQPLPDSESLAASSDCALFCELDCFEMEGFSCMEICGPCGEFLAPARHCVAGGCQTGEDCVSADEDVTRSFNQAMECMGSRMMMAMGIPDAEIYDEYSD